MENLNELKQFLINKSNELPKSINELNDLSLDEIISLFSVPTTEIKKVINDVKFKGFKKEPRKPSKKIHTYFISNKILNNTNFTNKTIDELTNLLSIEFYLRELKPHKNGFLIEFKISIFADSLYTYLQNNGGIRNWSEKTNFDYFNIRNVPNNSETFKPFISESIYDGKENGLIESIINHFLIKNNIEKKSTYVVKKDENNFEF